MVVMPGDIIVGDEDGVLAVPLADAWDILALALAQQERETGILRSITDGTIDRAWVDQTLKAKGMKL
jgi:regulator of RNase E activity RraA